MAKQEKKLISDFIVANFGLEERELDDDLQDEIIHGDLRVTESIFATRYTQLSDIRLKTNIEDLTDALVIVSSLQGKRYQWKSDSDVSLKSGGEKAIGLIAQEVLKVVPEVPPSLYLRLYRLCTRTWKQEFYPFLTQK